MISSINVYIVIQHADGAIALYIYIYIASYVFQTIVMHSFLMLYLH